MSRASVADGSLGKLKRTTPLKAAYNRDYTQEIDCTVRRQTLRCTQALEHGGLTRGGVEGPRRVRGLGPSNRAEASPLFEIGGVRWDLMPSGASSRESGTPTPTPPRDVRSGPNATVQAPSSESQCQTILCSQMAAQTTGPLVKVRDASGVVVVSTAPSKRSFGETCDHCLDCERWNTKWSRS